MDLRSGKTKSCGCVHKEHLKEMDLRGQRFGKLVAKRRAGRDKFKDFLWKCDCDCGNEHIASRLTLRSGDTKSCGCLKRETKYPQPKGERQAFYSYRTTARSRGFPFDLTIEQTVELMTKPCFYCGAKPSNVRRTDEGDFVYSGIDRINNKLGYTKGNCVPCCIDCNKAKTTRSLRDFVEWGMRLGKRLSLYHAPTEVAS
jgi:hypothetical protein